VLHHHLGRNPHPLIRPDKSKNFLVKNIVFYPSKFSNICAFESGDMRFDRSGKYIVSFIIVL
jgi:hypothetical protein